MNFRCRCLEYGSATISTARSRELAIRAAIGAQRGSLLGLIVRQGLVTAAAGVFLGIVASIAATQGLGALLYETPANDPVTFALTGSLLMIVATLAAYFPARRALAQNQRRSCGRSNPRSNPCYN